MDQANQKLTVGMLKTVPVKWDLEKNWTTFEEQFKRHQNDNINVFVTPECFLDGYSVTENDWTAHPSRQSLYESPTTKKL